MIRRLNRLRFEHSEQTTGDETDRMSSSQILHPSHVTCWSQCGLSQFRKLANITFHSRLSVFGHMDRGQWRGWRLPDTTAKQNKTIFLSSVIRGPGARPGADPSYTTQINVNHITASATISYYRYKEGRNINIQYSNLRSPITTNSILIRLSNRWGSRFKRNLIPHVMCAHEQQ